MTIRPALAAFTGLFLLAIAPPAAAQDMLAPERADILSAPESGASAEDTNPPIYPDAGPISVPPTDRPPPRLLLREGPDAREQKRDPLEMLALLPPAIQKEILDEADYTFEFCGSDLLLANFYDCSCVTLAVIERRINEGPGFPLIGMVRRDDYKQCASEPLAAGYAYNRCKNIYSLFAMGEKIHEDTCVCTARNVARSFARRAKADMKLVDRLFDNAVSVCRGRVRDGSFNP